MIGDDESWPVWRAVPRVAAGLLSLPVVAAFVALGAAVIVGRSFRDVVRVSRARRSTASTRPPGSDRRDSDAA